MLYLFIGVAGMIGSLLRYSIAIMTIHIWNPAFPLATLLVNLIGSFLLGWCSSYFQKLKKVPANIKTAITTGIIGSFTTFSTFCLETIQLIEVGDYWIAFIYMIISFLGGLLFVNLGIKVGYQPELETGKKV
ncbi:fluoride efflux transporter CrcB [Neobacillus sp. K501]